MVSESEGVEFARMQMAMEMACSRWHPARREEPGRERHIQ